MKFGAKPEMAPLSGIDEYMIHNSLRPQRIMHTGDPRAFERTWFTAQDTTGELLIVCGAGFYPNLDTADGYAVVVLRGKLKYVRFSRRLGLDRTDMSMGPLCWDIIEPFKTWKLTLDENPHGIRYEMLWHDTKRPMFSDMSHCMPNEAATRGFKPSINPPSEHVGYECFGKVEGWVEVDGERFELDPEIFRGSRDHHWGTRPGTGGFGTPYAFPNHTGQWVEFKDWSIWGGKNMYPWGDKRPGAGKCITLDRRIKFDPDTKEFREGIFTIREDDGTEKEIHYLRLGFQTAYLRCGGYGVSTPDEGGIHGVYSGEDTLYGGHFDLEDPAVRSKLGDLCNHHCEITCEGETTYGLIECFEPLLCGLCEKQEPGYQFM